ncbi:MAG: SAM-dependent DNA methyltransferase [Gammaproteobacteria bacterium]|nr:MAG: SAM-dependent DNA methyltransferase [Gammaproteobacteria bacterium]
MNRFDIIETIGREYFVSNLESDEFSYDKALKKIGKTIDSSLIASSDGKKHKFLDIRFVKGNVSILVETKNNFDKWKTESTYQQLQAYVNYESVLTGNKIIAILANTEDDRIKVWWGSDLTIDESHQIKNQYSIKTFDEYAEVFTSVQNDKEQVLKNTYALNKTLHKYGIGEKIRSQFVGTCLLVLKNNLIFEKLSAKQILGGIEETIGKLLKSNNSNKTQKLYILKINVLESQDIRDLKKEELQEILRDIENKILPYINEKSTMGQDILNLFFTTFNKYVGKEDKNQAFTPDHIVHFMCQVVGINRNSKVIDPCCGSGAFLVRAMTEAMDDCANNKERQEVKTKNIFGIEYEETAFGLATANMLIHGDGNSNVMQGSCFDMKANIAENNINVILMNPPYNAQRKHCDPNYVKNWTKNTSQDPSKGLHFVHYVASIVRTGKLAVLLPPKCAIGGSKIKIFKEKMLAEHTLDAVFSLPIDIFHPGSNSLACCMIFNLGTRHEKANQDTFFGYFRDDGFIKKKNLGRVEKTKQGSTEGVWADIESNWLSLYRKRKSVAGLSVAQKVTSCDEWLAEAYMETDYSKLIDDDFIKVVRDFVAFKIVSNQQVSGKVGYRFKKEMPHNLDYKKWSCFKIKDLFADIEPTKGTTTNELMQGNEIPYIGAKKNNNGLEMMCSKEDNEQFISQGNCIVFIQLGAGSAGYTTYQENKFIGMSGKTSCGYNNKLNKYNALFLVAILDQERPKFSFGRSWTGNRLTSTKIKLPVDNQGNPDWQFMEDYIKSLPYSANL